MLIGASRKRFIGTILGEFGWPSTALLSSISLIIPDCPVSVDRFSLRKTPHFHDVFDSVVTKAETKQAMPGYCDLANHLI